MAAVFPTGCANYPPPPPGPALKALTPKEYAILCAITDRLIPRGGSSPAGAADMDVARLMDDFVAGDTDENRSQFKLALALFEHGPLVFNMSPRTFTALPEADKDRYIQEWADSRLNLRRQIYGAFKKLTFMTFYSRPGAWPGVGYDGPWVK